MGLCIGGIVKASDGTGGVPGEPNQAEIEQAIAARLAQMEREKPILEQRAAQWAKNSEEYMAIWARIFQADLEQRDTAPAKAELKAFLDARNQ